MDKKRIIAAGSTCVDIVFGNPNITELEDRKDDAPNMYFATGGGGANFVITLKEFDSAYKGNLHITFATRLGRPPAKYDDFSEKVIQEAAREITQYELSGVQLIDTIVDREHKIPVNNTQLCHTKRHIYTRFNSKASPLEADVLQDIADNMTHQEFAFANTRDPESAKAVLDFAQNNTVERLLDYSVEKPYEYPIDTDEMIAKSTYLVAPGEARIKGQKEGQSLFDAIRELHPHLKHFAVSDGLKPIRIYCNGEISEIKAPQISVAVDKLGVGDARNAALAFFLMKGDDFKKAMTKASSFASFTIRFPGRAWKETFAEWVKAEPELNNADWGHEDRSRTIEFPRHEAA